MIIPLRTDSPLRRTPYVNLGLIFLNIAAFIAQIRFPWMTDHLTLDPDRPSVLNFLSYQFLHGGVMHLVGNMLFLYIFGNNVNDRLGQLGYLAFYLSGGVFAGIAYLVLGAEFPVLGASGSVSAVTGAYLVMLPRATVTIFLFFGIIGLFHISSMWLIAAAFLLDVFQSLTPDGGGGVANTAHIGGTVFGFGVCLLLLRLRLLPRDLFDVLALIDRWNRRRQHRGAVNRGYDPFAPAPMRAGAGERVRPDPKLDQIQDLRAAISESLAHGKTAQAAAEYLDLLKIDPNQVLSRQSQLDIANELYARPDYPAAAHAYEAYLRQYNRAVDSVEQVQLILGLLYARYLDRPDRARELLTRAVERLQGERELAVAREELSRLTPVS
jgi:membrane associated rhomboid family serine protease